MASAGPVRNEKGNPASRTLNNDHAGELRRRFSISHFDVNAVLRGAQLTLVGAHRALQNPAMFTSRHYRLAVSAVAAGVGIRLIVAIPIIAVKSMLWVLGLIYPLDSVSWDDTVIDGLNFIGEYVLQVPLFLMTLMRYIVPTLDDLFMQSLEWVDFTYNVKHRQDDPNQLREMYYENLRLYRPVDGGDRSKDTARALSVFLWRFAQKGAISITVFALSYLPLVGPLVLPAASFYTFNRAAGLGPASIIFGAGICLPRRYLVIFLQAYFSSRSLMRELLEPYFARIQFTKAEKRNWFRSREGVLFGFGLGFYILLRIPLVGVLVYGIAEASAAYMLTKVTDPPPAPHRMREYANSQQIWGNKHEFLSMPLKSIDATKRKPTGAVPTETVGEGTNARD